MSLYELSQIYREGAEALRGRIRNLSQAAQQATDPEEKQKLLQRITALRPMLQEANELTFLLAHYYEKGYHRNEHYTI